MDFKIFGKIWSILLTSVDKVIEDSTAMGDYI
jgi:hypothetical protein